jgi:hypothetical protein
MADFASNHSHGTSGFINHEATTGPGVIGDGIEDPDWSFDEKLQRPWLASSGTEAAITPCTTETG